MPLYADDDGRSISTHSMLKTFRRCPKQAEFKYVRRLKPRLLKKELRRGTWVHLLLEEYHNNGDWEALHTKLSAKYNELFDEEKDLYGDMPTEIAIIMRSYEWHYQHDPWTVLETEYQIETEFPDGSIYRGKVDAIVENALGIWIVDHKTHKTLPNHAFRLLDAQSALYLWAARRAGIPAQGFIWNYVRWKPPSVPALVDRNTRLSRRGLETDYPTFTRAVKQYKADHETFTIRPEYVELQKTLKKAQYRAGEPQTSPFFRRDVLEKDNDMLKQVARENYHTSVRMNSYDFEGGAVERVVETSCQYSCSFTDICAVELLGGRLEPLIKQNYRVGDPMDYYNDKAGELDAKREIAKIG